MNKILHPIGFSIPEEKIVNNIPIKKKVVSSIIPVSNLIPGHTYPYSVESEYYAEYQQSMFAFTKKKAGWDCMRHYEIMANGCIPVFEDIENCPKSIMTLMPKLLFIKANSLYDKYGGKTDISQFSSEEMTECHDMIKELLKYTRTHLTTTELAKYVLEKSNYRYRSANILYLSGDTSPDYMRCLTLHGLKQIFGKKCHDYPKVPHIYKSDTIDFSSLYGKGMTYSNLLDPVLHDDDLDDTVQMDIIHKHYDVVIYGSFHRGMPLYDLVTQIYAPQQIILLCGEDEHQCCHQELTRRGHYVFVRELY
jgi:hypothetical protein